MVHARIAARAVGKVKKEGGDVVGATSEYCTKAIYDVEDEEEMNEEENGRGERQHKAMTMI